MAEQRLPARARQWRAAEGSAARVMFGGFAVPLAIVASNVVMSARF